MRFSIKKICCIILSILMTISVMSFSFGCNLVENKRFVEKDSVFRFGAGWTPYDINLHEKDYYDSEEDFLKERAKFKKAVEDIKELGLDYFYVNEYQHGNTGSERFYTIAEVFEEVGVSVVPHLANVGLSDQVEGIGDIDNLKDYDKGFFAMYLFDEPHFKHFDTIKSWIPEIESKMPNTRFIVNLFPYYVGQKELGGYTYEEYVQENCEKVLKSFTKTERWLFVDYYPYAQNEDGFETPIFEQTWLYNMEILAENLKNVPDGHLGAHFQTCSYDGHREVSVNDLRQQLYVNMLFGVEEIDCYTYGRPGGGGNPIHGPEKISMVYDDGTPTHIYYSLQTVISEMKKFDQVYLQYQYDGIKTYMPNESFDKQNSNPSFDYLEKTLDSFEEIDSVWCTADTVISQMYNKNNEYAYIAVNYVDPIKEKTDELTIRFNSAKTVTVYIKGEPKVMEVVDGKINILLEPGEGCMIIPN